MEQNLFHGALGVLARDQISIALKASEVLAHFNRRYMAAAIDAAAVDNAGRNVTPRRQKRKSRARAVARP